MVSRTHKQTFVHVCSGLHGGQIRILKLKSAIEKENTQTLRDFH